jgi:hypothetical protein
LAVAQKLVGLAGNGALASVALLAVLALVAASTAVVVVRTRVHTLTVALRLAAGAAASTLAVLACLTVGALFRQARSISRHQTMLV